MTARADRVSLMQTFVRIVEAGTLSAAAEQLGTTQPTVSRRLHALESSLGLGLLQRTTHALQLTEAGQSYYGRAKSFLADWEDFETQLRGKEDVPEGLLRVVAPHAFGQQQLLAPALAYLRRYPKTSLEWRLFDGPVRFVEEAIDCLIRVGPVVEESVIARKIFEVSRIVVAAPSVVKGLRLTRPAQLEALPWLSLVTYYRNSIRLTSDRGAQTTLRLRPRFVTDNLFALRNAALEGLGVAVVSAWAVAEDLAAGRLVQLLPRWESERMPVYVVYPQARFQPARVRAFVEVIRATFANENARP